MLNNLTPEQREGLLAGAKLGSVWAAVGVTSWADVAAVLAAVYSALLIAEFLWKKAIKPFLQWRGYIK
jgi:hypothetical protein